MIQSKLKKIVENNLDAVNPYYMRTLLKEAVQDYILNFVYNHRLYNQLIFTGGTCMRKVYGLPRLSEDLDFNFTDEFDIKQFAHQIESHFYKMLQYRDIYSKIAHNEQSVYLKLPILQEIGLAPTSADSPILFVRCDFTYEETGVYETETNIATTDESTFFVLSYNLSTLFANKITAFLQRDFFATEEQTLPFKGRDVFDLIWFLEKVTKLDNPLKPNWDRLFKRLKKSKKDLIIKQLIKKLEKIEKDALKQDLLPFIESPTTVDKFCENFLQIAKNKLQYL